jgi:uncharacterized protein (TIGR00251 family)
VEEGRLKIKVTAPPERGKANSALVELLSKSLKVPKSAISVVGGQTSRNKRVLIEGISGEELLKRLGLG